MSERFSSAVSILFDGAKGIATALVTAIAILVIIVVGLIVFIVQH